MTKIYGIAGCDSCRAARKALPGAGFVDVRETPLDPGTRARFAAELGEALVNRRSTTWRGLSPADRALPVERLIAAHPTVMKRPVIETADGTLHLGWGAEVKAALGAATEG